MNLILDAGNTQVKTALFAEGRIVRRQVLAALSMQAIDAFCEGVQVDAAIFSSVARPQPALVKSLQKKFPLLLPGPGIRLPIRNLYRTPDTLGTDRLACATGAHALFPRHPVLAIDAGTCIKYDFVTAAGSYLGGAISPGLSMRFSALHTFTARLPLLEVPRQFDLTGRNTAGSIQSGVMTGALEEIRGCIGRYKKKYPDLRVVMTGGDMEYLAGPLKNRIFAAPDLVMQGLNLILVHNVQM